MDFYRIKERPAKNGVTEVYPDFKVVRSKDLMVQGKQFYAIWDEETGLWSTDEYDVQRLVDADLMRYKGELAQRVEGRIEPKLLGDFSSNSWLQFRNYIGHLSNSYHQLDEHLTFSNTDVKKGDYVSKRLPYPLAAGDISAYDELIGTLYDPDERAKIEWAIGAVISGDARHIQKFVVFYGPAGAGKSTILNIIQKLTEGYYTTFEAKALTSTNNNFATEVFRANPLVAIQHDGDLSRIEDNTKLNSIVSHEEMQMNEKYKSSYTARINAFLFMGTNKPVKITDAKSGIIRRLIDVQPSGHKLAPRRYQALMSQIDFELGAIAQHCLDVYHEMGKDYYNQYRPIEMMLQTDAFANYIESYFDVFKAQNGVSLSQAYELYKRYVDEAGLEFKLPQHKFREELKNYFSNFEERAMVDGIRVRSWYSGFKGELFTSYKKEDQKVFPLVLEETESLFDRMCADQPAQYASQYETPRREWKEVDTVLGELDTTQLHYVKPGINHIVIDFDLTDEHGNKSAERNLEEASKWPTTYAEFSKGGGGIHLHYIYDGDVRQLSTMYSQGIEIKVFSGNSSLRRRLSKCNNVPVATINSGLPLKEKKVINADTVKSEKSLRDLIERNLRKEIHHSTKPSIDFISKILEDAYAQGLHYDVSDMRAAITAFAAASSNQAMQCLKIVNGMKFASEEPSQAPELDKIEKPIVFYDIEVFPNLFVICWKKQGAGKPVRMINPSAQAVEDLVRNSRLIGFYNRRYDNHIMYAAMLGYSVEKLYQLSQRIINNVPGAMFGEAYELSYADVWDFASEKMSLKKWELELGLPHKEINIPWDQPVPEDRWEEVASYCDNDVEATEGVFEARKGDFIARQILADLSGLSVNSSTQAHTARIIFGKERQPQKSFIYTDLSQLFPGYQYDAGTSTYRGEVVGEGGYVYSEPGMYENVVTLDVQSMHPTSLKELNYFGPYTPKFVELIEARLAIKAGDYEAARKMLDGRLAPHLGDPSDAKALSHALKIAINIVYGLTAAKFENSFKDPRNKDNIVAKRGALFMIDLKHAVQQQGFQVVHIKTDSIKIPNATAEIIEFVQACGREMGYTFEVESTYEKFCLVNDAVYIAKDAEDGHWEAVGAQFQHPYVYKTLFTKEHITLRDMAEIKTVSTGLYLDFGDENEDTPMALETSHMRFVGKAGSFIPVTSGGGFLMREKDGKFHAANGTSGHRWLETEMVEILEKDGDIDLSYYNALVDKAKETISKFGDFERFVN